MLAALPAWRGWQQEIATLIAASDTVETAQLRLAAWAQSASERDDAAAPLYVASVQADLGGQLFVRAVEVPEAQSTRALRDERAPSFLSMPFEEAIRFFLARRIISPDEFRALSDAARQRAFTATRLATDELMSRAYRMLLAALRDGGTQEEFAQALRDEELSLGVTPSSPGYLETVFRTNVQAAYGAGRYRQITSPAVQAARPFIEYRTARDARVRPSHAALDGLLFAQTDPNWSRFAPPNGFNCYTGDTPVSGRILAAICARYAGPLLKLSTKAGRTLSITPNHPLATPHGFVPAGSIRQGDHVLGYQRHDRLPVVGAVDPEYGPPLSAKNLFRALSERHGAVSLRVVADDLHGDAERGNGHVDVVCADGVLLRHLEAEAAQHGRDPRLVLADVRLGQEHAGSVTGLGLSASGGSSGCLPSSGALAFDEGPVCLDGTPLRTLRLGPSSALDAPLSKNAGDDASADAECISKLLLGSAGDVLADEVVSVELMPSYHGHLYDVMTDQGWAVASGIVVSNCRCVCVARPASYAEGRTVVSAGSIVDGPDPGFDAPPAL